MKQGIGADVLMVLWVILPLAVGNFLYQALAGEGLWLLALERTYFQLLAVVVARIMWK